MLYPANSVIRNSWGPVEFVIESNNQGIRGKPVEINKNPAKFRIATIGDSMTDGFFVSNENTFQNHLEERLNSIGKTQFEVLNFARGGGSIDKEFAIFNEVASQYSSDLVILLFVSNDIYEIKGKDIQALRNGSTGFSTPSWDFTLTNFALSKSKIGNMIGHLAWRAVIAPEATAARKSGISAEPKGNSVSKFEVEQNLREFAKRFSAYDGEMLKDEFSEETSALLENYRAVLIDFKNAVTRNKAKFLFAYCPSYPEIYKTIPPMKLRQYFTQISAAENIDFLDLTEFFRSQAQHSPALHLTPFDFHFNNLGNRILAESLIDAVFSEVAETVAPPSRATPSDIT